MNFRKERLSNLISRVISEMIMKGALKDPRISTLLSISEVDVSGDVSSAKVHISGYMDEKKLISGVDGLNKAAGFIQSKLAKQMKTKNTPRLHFVVDTRVDEAFTLTQRIDDILENDSRHNSDQ